MKYQLWLELFEVLSLLIIPFLYSRILAVVRAGVVSLINPEYIFETTEWYNHPKYDPSLTLQPYDISLVKLQRPVIYTSKYVIDN